MPTFGLFVRGSEAILNFATVPKSLAIPLHFTIYFTGSICYEPTGRSRMITSENRPNPLIDPPPEEVPLTRAPLVRVLAQVKFAEVLNVENPEIVAQFQTAIAATYGVLSREAGIQVVVPLQVGIQQHRPMTHWRFADRATEWQWRVTLTSQFVTLEVMRYTSRSEFFARLESVLEAVQLHIKPQTMIRLGVRYVNRITGQELEDAAALVRPEIAGVVGTNMAGMVSMTVSETVFAMDTQRMAARWGLIPANTTVDPSIEPIPERCFMIDLDVFDETPSNFDSNAIAARGKQFARRSYSFFRWAVTPEFLHRFGGAP
jgi:uncharacterized protein (TIGR04255 family)